MDLHDAVCRGRFLIRDRDGKFPGLFDAVLGDAGVEVVLTGALPPLIDPEQIACLDIRRHQRLGGILNEYQHAV